MSLEYRIELIILNCLIKNHEFSRKVLPFIKPEYFIALEEKLLFEMLRDYIVKYGELPSIPALVVDLDNISKISENTYKELKALINTISSLVMGDKDIVWLIDSTEKFCQDMALHNALSLSVEIMNEEGASSKKLSRTAIPSLLSEALSVTFNDKIGHDYFSDSTERFEYYNTKEDKVPFDLEYFNKITNGGLSKGTLNVALAMPNAGKSLFMCHCAASNLKDGKNVLYITLEMSDYKIAKRIDANLFDIDINVINKLDKEKYISKINKIKEKTLGSLIVKQYPPASAHAGHFRYLLDELKSKKEFIPDIIYVDYLSLALSMRMKDPGNTYTYVKSISEEIRGIAVEFNIPIVSAVQTTRGGYNNSDVDMSNVAESAGISNTVDMLFAIISTEQLKEMNQVMIKQIKNRDNSVDEYAKFVIGIDKYHMRLYNLEETAQDLITTSTQQIPNTTEGGFKSSFDKKNKFASIKI